MEKKFPPRVWIDKRRIDEAHLSTYGGCGIATLSQEVKSDIIYLSLEEHQALIAPLIEALKKIASPTYDPKIYGSKTYVAEKALENYRKSNG